MSGKPNNQHMWRIGGGPDKRHTIPTTGERGTEAFHCERLRCKLTRNACGDQWRLYNGPRYRTEGHVGSACTGCLVGQLHARGEVHSEAKPVQLTARRSNKPFRKRICIVCGGGLPIGRSVSCSAACGSERSAFENLLHVLEINERLG